MSGGKFLQCVETEGLKLELRILHFTEHDQQVIVKI